jgi:recombination protein RecT
MSDKNALIPYQEKATSLHKALQAVKSQIEVSIPQAVKEQLSSDRMIRLVMTEFRENPRLQECSPESIAAALIKSAQLGLEPDGELGHAYLIPRWNKKTGKMEATHQRGYLGNLELVYRANEVKAVQGVVVYSEDHFVYEEGLDAKLEHRPKLKGPRGELMCAYARIVYKDGTRLFHVVDEETINRAKERSDSFQRAPQDSPWSTDTVEMWKKTAIGHACKTLSKSVEEHRWDDHTVEETISALPEKVRAEVASMLPPVFAPPAEEPKQVAADGRGKKAQQQLPAGNKPKAEPPTEKLEPPAPAVTPAAAANADEPPPPSDSDAPAAPPVQQELPAASGATDQLTKDVAAIRSELEAARAAKNKSAFAPLLKRLSALPNGPQKEELKMFYMAVGKEMSK